MKNNVFLKIVLLFISFNAFSSTVCIQHFQSPQETNDVVQVFFSFLDKLIDENIIEKDDLAELLNSIENNEVSNIFLQKNINLKNEVYEKIYLDYRDFFNDELKNNNGIKKKLLDELKVRYQGEIKTAQEMKEVSQDVKVLVSPPEFMTVRPGGYEVRRGTWRSRKAELTFSFDVTQTLITEGQWAQGFDVNLSYSHENGNVYLMRNNEKIPLENPVRGVTLYSVLVYLNNLSEKRGYQKVYDLSEVKWVQGTSAYEGNLQKESGEIRINAPKEYYYKTEGFRLPTLAEQEFMLKKAVDENGRLLFEGPKTDSFLKKFEDYIVSGKVAVQKVASKRPLIVDGNEIYDLLGNIYQMVWWGRESELNDSKDSGYWSLDRNNYPQGVNPLKEHHNWLHVSFVGGSAEVFARHDDFLHLRHIELNRPFRLLGFRAVRTVR